MKVKPTPDSEPLFSNAVHTPEMWGKIEKFLGTHSLADKSKEEPLVATFDPASKDGDKTRLVIRNPDGTVDFYVPESELTTHSQNREAEIRGEERDRLRELVSRHAFSIYDENLPSPVVSEQILLEALTPEQLDTQHNNHYKDRVIKLERI